MLGSINWDLVTDGNKELARFLREAFASVGVPVTNGNVYFVIPTADPSYTQFAKWFDRTYLDGTKMLHSTPASAYAAVTAGRNDVVALAANATHSLDEMLDVSKSRVTFIGLGELRQYGQGCKISLGVTTAATDIATVRTTGVRTAFKNIKFINNNTVNEGIYCFADGGEYTVLDHCELYKSTDLDVTGAAELVANGDSSQYRDCYIGSTVDAISGSIIRPCVTFSRELAASGKVARDVTFKRCIFARKCGATANRFVYGAEANAIERLGLFEDCIFFNLTTTTPAQNVAFGATLTDGRVLLRNCSAVGGATAMSTTTGVVVDGPVPAADTTGIALQAT